MAHTRSRWTLPAVALLSLVQVSCTTDPTSPAGANLALNKAIGRWIAAGIGAYQYRGTISCFCGAEFVEPMRVTVRNGRVTEVVNIRTGASQPTNWRQSIDSVFSLVRREIKERPERLEVTYDVTLGFPRTLTYGTPENDGGGYISIDSVRAIP